MRPIRRSWATRLAVSCLFVANGTAFGGWAGNLTRLRDQARLSDADLGLVLLAVSTGAVLAMPLTGRYAARIGPARLSMIAGALLAALLPLPMVVAVTGIGWPGLLAAAVGLGILLGTMDVAMNAHAATVERHWGAPIMSSFHAGWSFGELVGAAAAGLLARLAVGPVAAMVVSGAAVGLLALSAGMTDPAASGERPVEPVAAPARPAWPSRALIGICAVTALCFATEGGMADWSGVYLHTVLGASVAVASTGLSVFAATMACCRLAGDWAVRRLGPVAVVRLGGLLAALGLGLALSVDNVGIAAAALAFVGLGVSNVVPVMISAAGRRGGAAAIAMAATTGYGTSMAAPPLIGFVASATGLRAALLLLLAGMLSIAALARSARPAPVRPASVRA